MKRLFALLAALFLPAALLAQTYPVYENTYVNDYANAIEEGAEGRITAALKSLREETGVEMTVLTLYTRWGYDPGTLESFATGLFNHWGIGDADRNDGILVMVVTEDREMRIELGSGYGSDFNREAQDIIDRIFLPAFRDGNFSDGIEDGAAATITRIARTHIAGETPTGYLSAPASDSGSGGGFIGSAIAVGMFLLAIAAIFGRRFADRFRRCPSCGKRGIHTERHVLEAATRSATGRGEETLTCTHCGHVATSHYTIARRSSSSSSSGGSFGGGSSSGGGASGRW